MDRLAVVHSTLGDKLLFRSMNGEEALSTLFHYTVEMVSKDGAIDLKSLLGTSLSIQVKQPTSLTTLLTASDTEQAVIPDHWFNGDITAMALKGMESGSSRYYVYQAEVRPKLWYLTQNKDFRIYQEKTVPEIVKQVLADFNLQADDRLTQSYRAWSNCVQYNESAFDFISRLMEHEGIYYYFTHQEGEHKLVLADSIVTHESLSLATVPYRGPNASAIVDETCVDQWQVSNEIKPQQVSMNDYNFHKPYANMLEAKGNDLSYSPTKTEIYEWPGRFIDAEDAQNYTRIRKEEEAAQHEKMRGSATSVQFVPGNTFSLYKAPRAQDNQEYLLVSANYSLWDNSYASGEDTSKGQRTDFSVIPTTIPWRPERKTAWPKTQGPQTAQVVCPEGETIWTDKYGRVKVKFHWDRYAKGDDSSSCWIRVASSWAGQGFGAVQIPRLNDEVVVDFINGDPDRPLIIGRVYNEANTPPWDLPANATQMGFFSRSKTGHKGTANALRFEDKLGEEQVWIHAEKDMDTDIENNETLVVGANRIKTVGLNEINTIKGDSLRVVKNNDVIKIGINKTDLVGEEYYVGAGTKIRLECGKTVIELNANGKLNITCEEFNISAKQTGKINSINATLDLNIADKKVDLQANGATSNDIKTDVDNHFDQSDREN